jgi:hypothetical protein
MGNDQSTGAMKQVENYRFASGNVYSGAMLGTKRHGHGTLTWPDGARYEGSWVNDQCEGMGSLQFPNGSVFQGGFVRNNPYGRGKLTTANGEVLEGFWEYHGRSDQSAAPVGKYKFSGELLDLKSGQRRKLDGPLAFYLQSGLVSLPNMADPMEAMLPYAVVLAGGEQEKGGDTTTAQLAEEGRVLFQEGMNAGPNGGQNVPIAYAVQTAPSTSASVTYGQADPHLQRRHPEDHVAYSLLDPRLYLSSLGFPVQPANINQDKQQAIRQQQQTRNSTGVPIAVPVQANVQVQAENRPTQPVTFS